MDDWVDMKNVSMPVSKLFQVTNIFIESLEVVASKCL